MSKTFETLANSVPTMQRVRGHASGLPMIVIAEVERWIGPSGPCKRLRCPGCSQRFFLSADEESVLFNHVAAQHPMLLRGPGG